MRREKSVCREWFISGVGEVPLRSTNYFPRFCKNKFGIYYGASYLCHLLKPVILYKRITALVFLLAFMSQCFSSTLIVADYYANTSAYRKNCENIARPKMHCNGKCLMMKKLKQEEEKDARNTDRKAENKAEVLSAKSSFPFVAPMMESSQKFYGTFYPRVLLNRYTDIFHPPQWTTVSNTVCEFHPFSFS